MALVRKNIVIVADDFGISPAANAHILELARANKIDRVAVMVNGRFSDREIAELLATNKPLEIHLNLAQNPEEEKRKIEEGFFSRSLFFVFNFLFGKIRPSRVEKEWAGQIEKFKKLFGRYPAGLNSHEHIHFFPPYFKIAVGLARRFEIPRIRFGRKGIIKGQNGASKIISNLRKRNCRIFKESGLETSDFLASLDWIKDLEKFFNNFLDRKTEIVCHPERQREKEIISKYF